MLFQPSNIAPSTLSGIGIGTVDVTQGLDVSWQVNGDSPMTGYQITIYQNDSASTQMYTTGQITLADPFPTHDVYGNPMFFSTNISAATLSTAGIVNGYANGYKMIIKQWWSVSDYVEQTSASVFITRTTPTLSIDAIPNPVTSSNINITATYTQAQGDPISTVEWVLALAGLENNPIKQTGAINTQVLSFDADGLITGNTYSVMCNVVTSSGMEVSTGYIQFVVSYPSSSINLNASVAQMKNSSAVYLTWDSLGNNILSYPYHDSTKTTNGITFTVNGEGDVVATGTASADAYFTIAQGTLTQIGISAGQKLIITSGYSGANVVVEETNNSNVLISTITSSEPLQYIVPNTTNTLKISFVIPSGSVISTGETLQPMMCLESDIVGVNSMSAAIEPVQDLHGYANPWPAGGGKNVMPNVGNSTTFQDVTITYNSDDSIYTLNGSTTAAGNIPLASISPTLMKWVVGNGYTMSCRVVSGSFTLSAGSGITYAVAMFDSSSSSYIRGSTQLTEADLDGYTCTGNAFSSTGDYKLMIQCWRSGTVFNNLKIRIQLEAGSTATSWTPYENICPISGRTGLSVYKTGKNLLDNAHPSAQNASNIAWGCSALNGNADGTLVLPAGSYAVSASEKMNGIYVTDASGTSIKTEYNKTVASFTLSESKAVKVMFYKSGATDMSQYNYQLEVGSATAYEPFGSTYAVDWTTQAGTVYGGTVDVVTGELTITHKYYENAGTGSWGEVTSGGSRWYIGGITTDAVNISTNGKCNMGNLISNTVNDGVCVMSNGRINLCGSLYSAFADVNALKTYLQSNPLQVVYELATPVTYQLGADYIATLLYGLNNMWATSGNITLSYTKNTGASTTVSGPIVSFSDSNAKNIPTPQYLPGITGLSIYRYFQGEPILHRVYDFSDGTTSLLDYYAPSQNQVAYLIAAHSSSADLFSLTSNFTPVFWFYSILLCNQDSNGKYHVQKEFIFKYGVETGAVSNNNAPSLQQNFTRYPTRQPVNSLYKTGTLKGYIGTVSNRKIYTDSISLQNAIYEISTSTLTKFLKSRKGETIMVECSSPIQMQTGDNMMEQPLVATIDWVEVGDASDASIVSIPSDGFWPLP